MRVLRLHSGVQVRVIIFLDTKANLGLQLWLQVGQPGCEDRDPTRFEQTWILTGPCQYLSHNILPKLSSPAHLKQVVFQNPAQEASGVRGSPSRVKNENACGMLVCN